MSRILRLCFGGLAHFPFHAWGQVRIVSPSWLVDQLPESHGVIEGSTATFGAPFYGEDVLGRLVFGESKLGHQHCTADDYEIPAYPTSIDSEGTVRGSGVKASPAVKMINVVLVRRGKCSIVTKVKVAIEKGAHAVIVVDEEDSALSKEEIRSVIVQDDGFGANIHIPSILVSKGEGQQLVHAVKQTEVVVELAWNVPTDHVAEVDMWMSSGSKESLQFLADFAPKREALNDVMRFRPHMHVFSLPSSDPSVYSGLCSDTSGEYCAEDPDAGGSITGKDVLEEDVRQLCIHELTAMPVVATEQRINRPMEAVDYAGPYWDYISRFLRWCPFEGETEASRFGAACSEALMRVCKVNVSAVQRCAMQTQAEKLREQRDHTAWSPHAVRINGWRYMGMLDADLVTRAICSGFSTKPVGCIRLLTPRDPFEVYDGIKREHRDDVTVKTFVLGLLCVAFLMLATFILYRRGVKQRLIGAVREEVMLEVQAQMAAYNRLHEQQL